MSCLAYFFVRYSSLGPVLHRIRIISMFENDSVKVVQCFTILRTSFSVDLSQTLWWKNGLSELCHDSKLSKNRR